MATNFLFTFRWPVWMPGYEWRAGHQHQGDVLVLKRGDGKSQPTTEHDAKDDRHVRWYQPLIKRSGLFQTFAETSPTKQGILGFANEHGLLGMDRVFVRDVPRPGAWSLETLAVWRGQILAMREVVERWQGKNDAAARAFLIERINKRLTTMVSPRLVEDAESAGIEFYVAPTSLLGAMWLQAARAVSGSGEYRHCELEQCGRLFEVSPEAARTHRKYCCEAHKSLAYRRRKEARMLRGQGVPLREIADRLHTKPAQVREWLKQSNGL